MNTEEKSQLEINIPSSESSVTRNQKNEHTLGTELTRTTTLESAREKMQTLLDNPIFSGFLLIMAGIAIAFQAAAPWYAWIGGILGAYYVIINILTVPRLGAATVLSIFVCAQIIMACLIDHFALVGVAKRTYTVWRILASLGLVGCVVVIAKF
ncbi:hypothetical protein HPULCUR_001998 [Helicostylum pulchrum]|uniref:Uncharacterized protein n=1 Tax=Helicostylum pulchrum TaxID=562976 RepID=A0ABP9XQT6_9FUNG